MSEPGPSFTAPNFTGCYRHPERMTGISCQRCRRPICGECMTEASVGFQCPRCVGIGRASVRQARTRFGAAVRPGGALATKVLMGTFVAVWLLDLVTGGLASGLLAMSNSYVAMGQFWRLVTTSFVSGQLLGRADEPAGALARRTRAGVGAGQLAVHVCCSWPRASAERPCSSCSRPSAPGRSGRRRRSSVCWPPTRSARPRPVRTCAPTSDCSCCSSSTRCWSGSPASAGSA